MNEIINGSNLDIILEYCFNKFKNGNNQSIFLHEIQDEVLKNFSQEEIKIMVEYIDRNEYQVLNIDLENNPNILANEVTGKFLKSGGFSKIFKEKNNEIEYNEQKEILEKKILELQVEELEYKETIRNQNEKINKLTVDNLRLVNWDIRFRWYISVGAFILGLVIKHIIGK